MLFKSIISEANYGILQKDKRISSICDSILSIIKQHWKQSGSLEVSFNTDLFDFVLKEYKGTPHNNVLINNGAYVRREGFKFGTLALYILPVSISEALSRIDEIRPILMHEIKHALDAYDSKFSTSDNYINSNGKNYKQYVTQVQEIENFLITVLEDLRILKLKNKNMSLEEALKESFWWNHLYEFALYDYKKLNKFKSKLVTFWNKDNIPTIQINRKTLQVQLMLLLYQWHKDGDIKKAKEQGMNVVDVLKRSVEKMSVSGLKENIEKFKKLVSGRTQNG